MATAAPPKTKTALVYGYGPVGVLYSFLLCRAGYQVTAIARSNYAHVKDGVTLKSTRFGVQEDFKPARVVADYKDALGTSYDYLLCSFKTVPEATTTAKYLEPFLPAHAKQDHSSATAPTVVLLQNGVGIEDDLQQVFPSLNIISGDERGPQSALWIGCNARYEPTYHITHGKLERIDVGLFTASGQEPRADGLAALKTLSEDLQSAGSDCQVQKDILSARWSKNMWNAAFSTFSALSRAPTDDVVAPDVLEYTQPIFTKTLQELLDVGRALGLKLADTAVQDIIKITLNAYNADLRPAETRGEQPFKPSMLLDLEAGRPMELEYILGSVVRKAKEVNVPAPSLESAYAMLLPAQKAALRRAQSKA